MEKTMTHYKERDIYYLDDFNVLKNENISDLNNKLFCTFTDQEGVDPLLEQIQRSYSILYNKIFVLYVKSNDEYVWFNGGGDGSSAAFPYYLVYDFGVGM